MKSCTHKGATFETVLQAGVWIRASCSTCRRTGAFKSDRAAALAALNCQKVMAK